MMITIVLVANVSLSFMTDNYPFQFGFRNKDLSCTSDEEEQNLQDVMNSYNPAAKK